MTLERERAQAAAVAPVLIATAVPPTPCKVRQDESKWT